MHWIQSNCSKKLHIRLSYSIHRNIDLSLCPFFSAKNGWLFCLWNIIYTKKLVLSESWVDTIFWSFVEPIVEFCELLGLLKFCWRFKSSFLCIIFICSKIWGNQFACRGGEGENWFDFSSRRSLKLLKACLGKKQKRVM